MSTSILLGLPSGRRADTAGAFDTGCETEAASSGTLDRTLSGLLHDIGIRMMVKITNPSITEFKHLLFIIMTIKTAIELFVNIFMTHFLVSTIESKDISFLCHTKNN
jgi:hypothetical protein